MNWPDKISQLQNAPDDSRELKKGEVKELLISSFGKVLPSFQFVPGKSGTFSFQRTRVFRGIEVYEMLHVLSRLKDKMLACSVASILNKDYMFSTAYNSGFLVGHADLLEIKSGTGILKMEDSAYWHNGKIAMTRKVIDQITRDIQDFGHPYLDTRFRKLETSALIQFGLDFISNQSLDKSELNEQIEKELRKEKAVISRIKHPLYIELRDKLQGIPGQTREDRQEIPRLAFELIEFYCG